MAGRQRDSVRPGPTDGAFALASSRVCSHWLAPHGSERSSALDFRVHVVMHLTHAASQGATDPIAQVPAVLDEGPVEIFEIVDARKTGCLKTNEPTLHSLELLKVVDGS